MPKGKVTHIRLSDKELQIIEEIKNHFMKTEKITLNTSDIIKAALRHHYYIMTGKNPYEDNN